MHKYVTDTDSTREAALALAVAAIGSAWLLGTFFREIHFSTPWWLDTPAVLGFYGLFWKLYDSYLWRAHVGILRISRTPNLSGIWNGHVKSSHDGDRTPATLTIHQSATKILLSLATTGSDSSSVMATINTEPNLFHGIHYFYQNYPKTLADQALQPHRGQARLEISSDSMKLTGEYFTDHFRNNHGEMEFTK